MDSLTDKLQNKLETTYDGVWDTPHAFQYLPRFEKLSEVMPVGHLTEKYLRMINTFSQEMDRITRFFKKQVTKPPIPRNYPDSSGRIGNFQFSSKINIFRQISNISVFPFFLCFFYNF